MLRWCSLTAFLLVQGLCWAQQDTLPIIHLTPQEEETYKAWLAQLYEIGVVVQGDSIYISEEARQAATDSAFRAVLFPPVYTWSAAVSIFQQMQLKIGFWYLINLYKNDSATREYVLQYILTFENILDMDKVLISSFYTYAFLDPEVSVIIQGKPVIQHPEIVEQKLMTVKEILMYIMAYREKQKK